MKVAYSQRFRTEVDALERYIAARSSSDVALRYVDRLIDAVEGLRQFPDRFRLRSELGRDVRAMPFDGAYQVAYRLRGQTITVVALFGPGQKLISLKDTS